MPLLCSGIGARATLEPVDVVKTVAGDARMARAAPQKTSQG